LIYNALLVEVNPGGCSEPSNLPQNFAPRCAPRCSELSGNRNLHSFDGAVAMIATFPTLECSKQLIRESAPELRGQLQNG
jgi:hypothetical protein